MILQILLTLATAPPCESQARSSRRPHIVLIVADDLGWADVGWRDSEMYTPVLDHLAREGVILDQAYMQSSCTPSRAALMTGRYPFRVGLQHTTISAARAQYLTDDVRILPQYLKDLGYATHIVGKWHLGFCNWRYTPTYRGFDTFYGYYNAAEGYYNHTGKKNGYDFRDNLQVDWSAMGHYSTHLFAARAQRIIRNHNPSQPLFLYLPFQGVHGPFEVPEHYIQNHCAQVEDDARRIHCGMVAALDEAIGNVTRTLEEAGLLNNALLVFSTDNGGPTKKGSSNWPLRGSKTTLWEGGNRAVSFLYGRSLLQQARTTYTGLIHVVDWLPTLMGVAGSDGNNIPSDIDGMNLWSHISTGRDSPRREFVYNINDVKDNAALRLGKYKLIQGKAGKPNGWYYPPRGAGRPRRPKGRPPTLELFDLERDPTETTNIADEKPDVVQRMLRKLDRYRRDLIPTVKQPVLREAHPRFANYTWSPGYC